MAEGSEVRGRAQPARTDDPGAGGCRLQPACVAIAALDFECGKGENVRGQGFCLGLSLSLAFSLSLSLSLFIRWHG